MSSLLHGVRVLDLTNVIAGPMCSYLLAMLGAEVVKVEVPRRGDLSRRMGVVDELVARGMGDSFCAMNAGKKSIALNLKSEAGRRIFLDLAGTADVVLENFRPGVMARLGLGWDVLKAANPGLVYCAISGFGQTGPLAGRPSYDQIIQGFSGLMSLTGAEDGEPARAGYVVCDTMAAVMAAFAVSAALVRKARSGEGEMIDVSMLDSTLSTMASWLIAGYVNGGVLPARLGNHNPSGSPSGTFRTGDGQINISINEQDQYERLCDAVGLPELKADPRFLDREARIRHRKPLQDLLEGALARSGTGHWEEVFARAGVPAGPVLDIAQAVSHPQVQARQLLKRFEHVPGTGRGIAVTRLGFHLASGNPDVSRPPPRLGEDTAGILGALGLDAAALRRLQDEGVIDGCAPCPA